MYFLSFRIFEQLALALKNRRCPEFTIFNVFFYYSGVLSNLRLPWKQSFPGIFHCIEYTFYIQNFWATCASPAKQNCPGIFHYTEIYFIIQDFWATCACPAKQNCPGIFHYTEIYFIIQDFWATCGCLENRVCPEIYRALGRGRPPRPPASYAYGNWFSRRSTFPHFRFWHNRNKTPAIISCIFWWDTTTYYQRTKCNVNRK